MCDGLCKKSNIKFRELFELLPDGVVLIDTTTKLPIMYNKEAYTQLEYEKEEFAKVSISDYEAVENPQQTAKHIQNIIANGRDDFETKHKTKNGKILDIRVTVLLNVIEDIPYFLCVFRDISEQKTLEQNLRYSQERFSDVSVASGEYIWELDEQGEYIFLTKPFEDMMGYTLEESLGRTPFSFMPQDEQKRVSEYFLDEVAKNGIPFVGLTHRSLTKDGKTVWQKVNGLPMFDKDRNIIGYRGAARDITNEKKAQEELESAKQKAEEASSAKTQFLANMSHEIRTPMNAIIGLGDVLDDMIEEPKQKNMLSKINTSSKMLLGIINDILDYSKIEAGKLELEHKQFRLEDILSQLKVMFEQKASQKGLELYFYPKWDFTGDLLGDELRLTQVLTNLLSNAIKFIKDGNIVVTIEFHATNPNKKVVVDFSVEDSGIGMSDEQMGKLFQPFTQADSSTTRKYGGTGLGLVISKNIINAMGGDIKVQSKEGLGTKFYFSLEFDLHSYEIKKSSEMLHEKALIVDDQEISREVLKNMLDRFAYSYDEACDGLEAIECIKKSDKENAPYDILLIDWNMPNLNGVDTIKKLQEMVEKKELSRKIPTIFMVSGYSKEDIELESIAIDSFISKPITASDLFDAISDAKGGKSRKITLEKNQPQEQFANIRVLIVEDNVTNQEVISLMLEKVGITYEIANNGKEGVEIFFDAKKKFDLILMDIQMPIMGGYECAQKIREKDKNTPIVALTAAAMIEDKQKAFEAGMNEHIAKPIDKNELYRVISKLTSLTIDFAKTKQSSKCVLDMEYLEEAISSKERINSLLLKLKEQLATGEFQDIEKEIAQNSQEARAKVHTLKGVSGNIGALELCEVLTFIDAKYKKEDTITQEDIQSLKEAKETLLRELEKIKDVKSSHQTAQLLENNAFHTLFATVQDSLSGGLKVQDEKIEILYENLQQRVDKEELLKWKELIDDFDFDEAFLIMQGWKI